MASPVKEKATALTAPAAPAVEEPEWAAASPIGMTRLPRLRPPVVMSDPLDAPKMPSLQVERTDSTLPVPAALDDPPFASPTITLVSAMVEQPPAALPQDLPIPVTPYLPTPPPPAAIAPAQVLRPPTPPKPAVPAALAVPETPEVPPNELPPLPRSVAVVPPSSAPVGSITVGGKSVPFDTLAKLVDGQGCGAGAAGCSTCGTGCPPGRPCPAGGRKCEPFPDTHHHPLKRFVGLVYDNVCCPDPCYQPRWEPLADSAFFVDAPRPKSNTRFRWDYGHHLAFPDRGEYFYAKSGSKGPSPVDGLGLMAIPWLDYHELSVVSEIASGAASVAISLPYRTVNNTPFGLDAAGFADMTITAKSLLVDSDLFLCALQTRTYILTGAFRKGLGVGHMSLEPGLLFGLRLTPDTYLQAHVLEWIPLGGDADHAGAHLRWATSLNHVLWRPVKDVQLIGTAELNGICFQDGLLTDPLLGPQKLSGQNIVSAGTGFRIFFCDTLDVGIGGNFGITGKYLTREQMRFEMRFRY